MPELEELPITDEEHQEMSVQNMVDRVEGHSHGHAMEKQSAEPQGEVPEKNVVDIKEASKMMAEGIFGLRESFDNSINRKTTAPDYRQRTSAGNIATCRNISLESSGQEIPQSAHQNTQRRVLRERAAAKRELAGTVISKSKFCRKSMEDKNSDDNDDSNSEDDTQGNRTIDFHVGNFTFQ
ncbi:hypothetical protein F511_23454 [Dorcoceras hygrometricum]|uniref:Uncharacterized protein n=1 Tax=Dorcoceras hygrometricum TaxID=472368 RepID=A0A2Z7BU98_9LAMI|nr:hypothetical protein F511_23454 [Dorcoceras hygrometricum]